MKTEKEISKEIWELTDKITKLESDNVIEYSGQDAIEIAGLRIRRAILREVINANGWIPEKETVCTMTDTERQQVKGLVEIPRKTLMLPYAKSLGDIFEALVIHADEDKITVSFEYGEITPTDKQVNTSTWDINRKLMIWDTESIGQSIESLSNEDLTRVYNKMLNSHGDDNILANFGEVVRELTLREE